MTIVNQPRLRQLHEEMIDYQQAGLVPRGPIYAFMLQEDVHKHKYLLEKSADVNGELLIMYTVEIEENPLTGQPRQQWRGLRYRVFDTSAELEAAMDAVDYYVIDLRED